MANLRIEKALKDAGVGDDDSTNVDQVATTRGAGFDPVLKGPDFFTGPRKQTPAQDAQLKAMLAKRAAEVAKK